MILPNSKPIMLMQPQDISINLNTINSSIFETFLPKVFDLNNDTVSVKITEMHSGTLPEFIVFEPKNMTIMIDLSKVSEGQLMEYQL